MDRFSKTTEIDTAEIAAAAIEDDTPKKSKATIIIALVLCILASVIIWLFVMETDTETAHKGISNVPMYTTIAEGEPSGMEKITVNGIRKDIIDFRATDFVIILNEDKYQVSMVGEKAELYTWNDESTDQEYIISVRKK